MTKDFKPIYIYYTAKAITGLLIFMLLVLICTPFALLYIALFDREKKIYLKATRVFIKLFFYLNFINIDKRVDLKAIEGFKKRNVIYVMSHFSLLDGFLLFLLPGQIKFMAKERYAKLPIFGLGITLTGNIAIKNSEKQETGETIGPYYQAEDIVRSGHPLAIFPEGTRSRNGKMGRFYNSAFMLAIEEKADIVPIMFDTWHALPPGPFMVKSNNFQVKALPPLRYEEFKELSYKELSDLVKEQLLEALVENRQKRKSAKVKLWESASDSMLEEQLSKIREKKVEAGS